MPDSAPILWAEQNIGPRWRDKFFYWLMRLGGKSRGYHMAAIISFWYVLFYPSIRRRCAFYLTRRFPGRRDAIRRFLDVYRLVRTYAYTLVDQMALMVFGADALAVESPTREALKPLAAGERGFVLVHAHVGCWQIGMSTLGHFDKKIAVVMIPDAHSPNMFDPKTTRMIDPRTGMQSLMEMTDALLGGDILAMMGDRTIGNEQNLIDVQFLGAAVRLPTLPYRLASATGVPVVVLAAPRINKRAYEMRLAKVIEVPPGIGRDPRAYAPYAQQFADFMEDFVRDHPWQYYNFFDLWETPKTHPSA